MTQSGKKNNGQSFSAEVKRELAGYTGSARHCRIAELAALLRFCAGRNEAEDGERRIFFQTEHREVADKFLLLLQKVFHMDTAGMLKEKKYGEDKTRFTVEISDEGKISLIRRTAGIPDGTEAALVHQPFLQRNCCRRAFLRGAFLASGSISDPNRSYHFEIVCEDSGEAEGLQELIGELGIRANVVRRKRYFVVYVKESSQISDLLGLMDARVSMLNFENIRVLRDVRGNINRRVNCETANIGKTASAAARQIEDIEFIERTVGFSKLSNRLDEVAQIRLQYPTATLAELGGLMDPPLGKSGVNHRLRRLGEIADGLREEQGGNVQDG